MSNLTPSTIAYDVLRNQRQYALVQEILKHESGYPYLRQVLALYAIEQDDGWDDINVSELLVEEP
jgi:hypothetical protein